MDRTLERERATTRTEQIDLDQARDLHEAHKTVGPLEGLGEKSLRTLRQSQAGATPVLPARLVPNRNGRRRNDSFRRTSTGTHSSSRYLRNTRQLPSNCYAAGYQQFEQQSRRRMRLLTLSNVQLPPNKPF
jgi:hypothetical protein